jgi:glutathione synthase/RimK-type ligase-like ATP-grasp enzyme
MLQLKIAAKVGFRIPETILTNNPEAALRFADKVNSDLAIKSLGALSATDGTGSQASYGLFTRRVTRTELLAVKDKISNLPTTFQPFIPKSCELRITCVGEKIFTCRIQARPGDLTADDYRFDTQNLTHTAWEAPQLHDRIHDYMRHLSLNFACFDFIVPLQGEPVFLEANANGQFAWVENLTGLPIAKAIAYELMS